MTYAEAFSKIKKKLIKADTSTMKNDFAIQVTIKDEDAAGTFYVAFIDGVFSVEPYDYRDNSVAIDISVSDFIKLAEGKLTAEKAISDGKLYAFGNEEALNYIFGCVKATVKKTASKKSTDKKTTAKKDAPKATEKKPAVKKEAPKAAETKPVVKKEAPKTAEKKTTAKKEAPKAAETKPAVKKEAPKAAEKKTTVKKEAPVKTEKTIGDKTK